MSTRYWSFKKTVKTLSHSYHRCHLFCIIFKQGFCEMLTTAHLNSVRDWCLIDTLFNWDQQNSILVFYNNRKSNWNNSKNKDFKSYSALFCNTRLWIYLCTSCFVHWLIEPALPAKEKKLQSCKVAKLGFCCFDRLKKTFTWKLLCHDIFPRHPTSLEYELHREKCYTQLKIWYLPEALKVLLYALNMFLEMLTTCTVV